MGRIKGLTGYVSDASILPMPDCPPATGDISIKLMAEWAFNYLIRSPKPEYNYQPVFQVFPLRYPSVREGDDPVVNCDTDARMDWEWYYMRDIVGDSRGADIENKFHARMRAYINADGLAIAHGGCYREDLEDAVYSEEDNIIHVWGTTKILNSLAEDYLRTQNPERLELATRIVRGLKKLFIWGDEQGEPWCYAPNGMGPVDLGGKPSKNSWGTQPDPVVGPLIRFWQASGDSSALLFARAAANGIMWGKLPGGLKFSPDGSFRHGDGHGAEHPTLDGAGKVGHSHATLHAVWGVGELGLVVGDENYIEFAKRSFDWMLSRGTGTGWFPAMPDNCNETCTVSDMISIAALLGRADYSEYFDYAERYFRNYIVNLQFILTDEMREYYRRAHADRAPDEIEFQLNLLNRIQGAIIGGSGINDYENNLLGRVSGFCIFGCCAPEGMRAIHTIWRNTAVMERDGLHVNMAFNVDNSAATVTSLLPLCGGMKVKPKHPGLVHLRVAHWANKADVLVKCSGDAVSPRWEGDYAVFDAKVGDEITVMWPLITFTHRAQVWNVSAPDLAVTFEWEGNRAVSVNPSPQSGAISLLTRDIRQDLLPERCE